MSEYNEIDWKGVKGVRDVLSHNYFNIDAEEIYYICKQNLEPLQRSVKKMLADLQQNER